MLSRSALLTVWLVHLLAPPPSFGHGQPAPLAFWGNFRADTALCQRVISQATALCGRRSVAAHANCGIGQV
ncbi:MAG TPA: hypothetical protein VEB21_18190, partial [Terriglobales bacterium]|nr:hypothetical protein [Terriglobales bacterium]